MKFKNRSVKRGLHRTEKWSDHEWKRERWRKWLKSWRAGITYGIILGGPGEKELMSALKTDSAFINLNFRAKSFVYDYDLKYLTPTMIDPARIDLLAGTVYYREGLFIIHGLIARDVRSGRLDPPGAMGFQRFTTGTMVTVSYYSKNRSGVIHPAEYMPPFKDSVEMIPLEENGISALKKDLLLAGHHYMVCRAGEDRQVRRKLIKETLRRPNRSEKHP